MMNRRALLRVVGGLGSATLAGCSKLTFLPQPRVRKKLGFDAVTNGMSERQVVELLGEPTRRSGFNVEGSATRARNLVYVGNQSLVTVTLIGDQVVAKEKI